MNLSTSTGRRLAAGWLAVGLSTAWSGFWAIWGSIENFHEGWYFRELWRNMALMLGQYLAWMFVPMLAGLLVLCRRPVGLAAGRRLLLVVRRGFARRSACPEAAGRCIHGLPVRESPVGITLPVLLTLDGVPLGTSWSFGRRVLSGAP